MNNNTGNRNNAANGNRNNAANGNRNNAANGNRNNAVNGNRNNAVNGNRNNAVNGNRNNAVNGNRNNAANGNRNNSNNANNKGNNSSNNNSNNANSPQKSSLIKDIAIAVGILIVLCIVIYFASKFLKKMLLGKNDSPWIIKKSKNAKNSKVITQDPKNENSITLYRSDNQHEGAEFTYSVWFVIENLEYKYGEWKHMFHKGNKTAEPNKAPGVFLHPTANDIRIYMNTISNPLEYVDIQNIPIKRWVHMAIVLKGHNLDVYINGYLRKRHELSGPVKQNFGDIWLNLYGGFEGYMCRMRYYRHALEYNEVEDIVKGGPSLESCGDSGEKPPYLGDNWWFDF